MRSINLYLEYLLIFIISVSTIYFVYNYYENNRETFSLIFLEREEDLNLKIIDSYIRYIIDFYNASEFLNLKINGICKYNYTIFYKTTDCAAKILDLDYSEDIIKQNHLYYFYSNLTNKYYLVTKKSPKSFEGCYENKYSYIVLTNLCEGSCIRNCYVIIKKEGKELFIYLK